MERFALRKIVSSVCDDYIDTLLTGIEENEDDFPYTIACSNFIDELKKLEQNTQISVATPVFNLVSDETLSIAEGQISIDDIGNPFVSRDVMKTKYTESTQGAQVFGYIEKQSYNGTPIYVINPFNY